ncbi:hypothetical protein [Kaistella antarctica]|uniref:Uncharacterized protein n=1 Tax=Kaistella antarctica TaxID=266748 RepID=A0A3S4UJK0_9FLAO|nr:hypothetical protein [Kaistella antarctica]KEY19709.1 hypothetical protein HY04_00285 [Kaistella antarctica]SEV98704.1 hypothetical protein SAMN05421765_1719 [Kaistella antarctica]VEH96680.1 Uncharacterised protein [Kaistella antarctica]
MKKLMLATAVLMLVACSKEEKVKEEKSGGLSDLVSTAKNYGKVSSSMEDVTKNMENLKNIQPLTNDELKSVLPETLLGLKRKELSVGDNAMMNLATAEAKYADEEIKRIKVDIIDGAGETGSAMVSIMMMGLNVNKEKTTEFGFEKSTEINGAKSIVSETKNGEGVTSEIQTVLKNRYLVTLNADGFSYEELKMALGEFNISALK